MSNQTLPQYAVPDLADALIVAADESRDRSLAWLKILKLLLKGRPLSPEQIASALQLSQEEVSRLLQGAELDRDGNVVGLGLSLVPTRHSYQIDGHQFYVWCAVDAILFPAFHQSSAVIESPDPISGETVRLTATPKGLQQIEPGTAVVSWAWLRRTGTLENIRTWGCDFTHFFTSAETASQYVAQHPGLVIVPVEDVFQVAQLVWGREPFKSVIAGS